MLSWLNPYNFFLYLMCKLMPRSNNCREYLLQAYGHCYLNRHYDIYSVTRLPRWFWNLVFAGGDNLMVDTTRPECIHLMYPPSDSWLDSCVIAKLIVVIGFGVSLVYGALKVASQRTAIVR